MIFTSTSILVILFSFALSYLHGQKPSSSARKRVHEFISSFDNPESAWNDLHKDAVLRDFVVKNEEGKWVPRENIADFDVEVLWGDAPAMQRFWLEQGPGFFVAAGIFFTFVGIALGLSDLDLSSSTENMQGQIGNLVEGLETAFYSSIAGVFCSVLFTWFRTQWTAEAEQATQRLRRHLIQQGRLLTTESLLYRMVRSQEAVQKATNDNKNHLVKLVEKADDLDGKVGTLATDIAEQVSGRLGDRMDAIVNDKLASPLNNIQDSFNNFATGQVASQSDTLAAVVQTFVDKLQSELHVHFDELAFALRETRDWYEQTHQIYRETGVALGVQVSLQQQMLEEERRFFAGMHTDLRTLASHREQLTKVESDLLHKLTANLQHARGIEEDARNTLASLKATAEKVGEMNHQQSNTYQNLLLKSDQLTQQMGRYATQVQAIGEDFRKSLDQLRRDLGEGMTSTFSSFDEQTAKVVNHLNGSFTLLNQSSSQFKNTLSTLEQHLKELRHILQKLTTATAQVDESSHTVYDARVPKR